MSSVVDVYCRTVRCNCTHRLWPGLPDHDGQWRNTTTDGVRAAQPRRVRGKPIERLAPGTDPSHLLRRGQATVSERSAEDLRTSTDPHSRPHPMTATPAGVEAPSIKPQERPQPSYAKPGHARVQALRMVWPIVCRRLEGFPNANAMQLFDELCIQFPDRFTRRQYKSLLRRVNLWRQDVRARGVVIGPKKCRRLIDKPRGRRRLIFNGSLGRDGTMS